MRLFPAHLYYLLHGTTTLLSFKRKRAISIGEDSVSSSQKNDETYCVEWQPGF